MCVRNDARLSPGAYWASSRRARTQVLDSRPSLSRLRLQAVLSGAYAQVPVCGTFWFDFGWCSCTNTEGESAVTEGWWRGSVTPGDITAITCQFILKTVEMSSLLKHTQQSKTRLLSSSPVITLTAAPVHGLYWPSGQDSFHNIKWKALPQQQRASFKCPLTSALTSRPSLVSLWDRPRAFLLLYLCLLPQETSISRAGLSVLPQVWKPHSPAPLRSHTLQPRHSAVT